MADTFPSCEVCGVTDGDVRLAIVHWSKPVGRPAWEAVPRCLDRTLCAGRVAEAGGRWPLVETTAKTPQARGWQAPKGPSHLEQAQREIAAHPDRHDHSIPGTPEWDQEPAPPKKDPVTSWF